MEQNIVKEYIDGNTRIKICNDYFINKTEEDIKTILKDCAQIASKYFTYSSFQTKEKIKKEVYYE